VVSTLSNISAVARREYLIRLRTRSFVGGTLLLVAGVVLIALLPVIIRYVDRSGPERIAVHAEATDLRIEPIATLTTLLNGPTSAGTDQSDFEVVAVPDVASARPDVVAGQYTVLVDIRRASDGELAFTLYSNNTSPRATQLAQGAANAMAMTDRLARAGLTPVQQANLFAPAELTRAWADPARTEPLQNDSFAVGQDLLAFGMTVLIFMIILLYGQWIAMSVVEEKSSRVMEVVLNAATPLQLLAGKVVGVGAVALTQYAALVTAGVAALLLQGQIATAVLGDAASTISGPEGLSVGLLLAFGLYGVLGFLLYAVLYAAAGSLVSRQEDVNTIVMPMTLVSTAGYLVGVYAAMGLLNPRAAWVGILAQVPLVSPFMMLARITAGQASIPEVVLSVVLLVAAIAASLWLAARIYAFGVLMYGQRPSIRAVWRLLRHGI
jgi:ABC-2 type transport system permease protein